MRLRSGWLAVLAAAGMLEGGAAARAQEAANACLECHDTVKLTGSHASVGCADCHSNVSVENHPDEPLKELGGPAICAQCHDAGDQLAGSVHAPVACAECHGTAHSITGPKDNTSPVSPFHQLETCAKCHDDGKVVEGFRGSVHGKALLDSGLASAPSCTSCHGVHDILKANDPKSRVAHDQVPETCGACHQLILDEWQSGSAHGMAWKNKDERAPVCTTCHESQHSIERPTSDRTRLRMAETCGQCHKGRFETYHDSFHGKATDLGFVTAATCADCHTPHKNLPAKDPRSTVNPKRLATTCGECHGNVTAKFLTFDPHAEPSNKESNAVLYWVWFFMTALLISTFAFFGLHDALWLQRAIVAIRRKEIPHEDPKGPWVRRFKGYQTVVHRVVIVSFLLLAATGLPMKFHVEPWAHFVAGLFGGVGITTGLHRFAAVLTFGYFLFHLCELVWRGVVKKEPGLLYGFASMVPRPKDLTDLWDNLKWFLYLGKRPKLDRFAYWEKFDYFAVFWGVMIIGGSGLVLWQPQFFTQWLPGWVLNAAYVVHSDEALLATGFIFVFHFFHTHLRPEAFPLDPVIFLGGMPLARLEHERPAEYRRLVESGKLDEYLMDPPSDADMRRARLFGFTAVAIGLLLAVGIVVALLP